MRRASDRTFEQPGDALLEPGVRGQSDRAVVALSRRQFIDLGVGEGGVGAKIPALSLATIAGDHRFQYVASIGGAVGVTGPQRAPLQVAELVEQEQRVIAGAAEVAVVGDAILDAVRLADAVVHVEQDDDPGLSV